MGSKYRSWRISSYVPLTNDDLQSGRPGWTRNVVAIISAKSMELARCVRDSHEWTLVRIVSRCSSVP